MAQKDNYRNLKYQLTDDDTIAFNKYFVLHSDMGRKTIFQQKIIFPILTVIVVPMLYFFKFNIRIVIGCAVLMVVASILMLIFGEKMVLRQQEKAISKGSYSLDALHKSDVVLEFGDEEVFSFYEERESSFGYDRIVKVSKTGNGMYIWLDERSALPVPESAFNKSEGMSKLFSYLQEKCPNAVFEEFEEKYERSIKKKNKK